MHTKRQVKSTKVALNYMVGGHNRKCWLAELFSGGGSQAQRPANETLVPTVPTKIS
jgi:hypothetical protein